MKKLYSSWYNLFFFIWINISTRFLLSCLLQQNFALKRGKYNLLKSSSREETDSWVGTKSNLYSWFALKGTLHSISCYSFLVFSFILYLFRETDKNFSKVGMDEWHGGWLLKKNIYCKFFVCLNMNWYKFLPLFFFQWKIKTLSLYCTTLPNIVFRCWKGWKPAQVRNKQKIELIGLGTSGSHFIADYRVFGVEWNIFL